MCPLAYTCAPWVSYVPWRLFYAPWGSSVYPPYMCAPSLRHASLLRVRVAPTCMRPGIFLSPLGSYISLGGSFMPLGAFLYPHGFKFFFPSGVCAPPYVCSPWGSFKALGAHICPLGAYLCPLWLNYAL
jgi:hypothetical protein